MTTKHRLCGIVAAAVISASAFGEDWPQFGGPKRDFVSSETGLARAWPAGGPKVLWTATLNKGYGGAAMVGGEAFLLDRSGTKDVVLCLDAASGKELWRYEYDAPGKVAPPGSRCTPAVDDKRVFAVGPMGQMHCIDRKTHQPLWKAHLVKDFDGELLKWNVAQNPVLCKDWVLVAANGKTAGVVAFERATGRVAWRSPHLPGMMTGSWEGSYVSPVLAEIAGVPQAIIVTAQGTKKDGAPVSKGLVAGVSLADGALLWSYDGWQCDLPIPAPAVVGDGRIFISAAYDAGSAMIAVGKSGDRFKAEEAFKTTVCGCQVQQPVVYQGHIYAVSNGKERKEGLMCLDLTGAVKWNTTNSRFASKAAEGMPNFDNGSLLIADGMIFIVDAATGDLRLIEATAEKYKELARAEGLVAGQDNKPAWGPMALSSGRLIVRAQKDLKCLDVGAKP
jgi:outer membrane protein assembly factor BamB